MNMFKPLYSFVLFFRDESPPFEELITKQSNVSLESLSVFYLLQGMGTHCREYVTVATRDTLTQANTRIHHFDL